MVAPCDETFSTNGPVCPYCDHQHSDLEPGFYDENADAQECEHCTKTFHMFVCTSTSWTCTAIEPLTPEHPND